MKWNKLGQINQNFSDYKDQGSTVSAFVTKGSNIILAGAGDALSFGYLEKNGKILGVWRLNAREHNPTLQEENDRIINAGGKIEWARIYNTFYKRPGVNISRSLGDFRYTSNGQKLVIPDADITIYTVEDLTSSIEENLEGANFYLVSTCDGIVDIEDAFKSKDRKEQHASILQNALAPLYQSDNLATPHSAASAIVQYALDHKSGDNCTAMVDFMGTFKMVHGKLQFVATEDKAGAVFDGHGGSLISDYAALHFIPSLEKNCQLTQEAYKAKKTSIHSLSEQFRRDNKDPSFFAQPVVVQAIDYVAYLQKNVTNSVAKTAGISKHLSTILMDSFQTDCLDNEDGNLIADLANLFNRMGQKNAGNLVTNFNLSNNNDLKNLKKILGQFYTNLIILEGATSEEKQASLEAIDALGGLLFGQYWKKPELNQAAIEAEQKKGIALSTLQLYKAADGQLGVHFASAEDMAKFLSKVKPQQIPAQFINPEDPQFKHNKEGMTPFAYGKENCLYFASYGTNDFAINLITQENRDAFIQCLGYKDKEKRVINYTNGDTGKVYGALADIPENGQNYLFMTFENQRQNSAIYFNIKCLPFHENGYFVEVAPQEVTKETALEVKKSQSSKEKVKERSSSYLGGFFGKEKEIEDKGKDKIKEVFHDQFGDEQTFAAIALDSYIEALNFQIDDGSAETLIAERKQMAGVLKALILGDSLENGVNLNPKAFYDPEFSQIINENPICQGYVEMIESIVAENIGNLNFK